MAALCAESMNRDLIRIRYPVPIVASVSSNAFREEHRVGNLCFYWLYCGYIWKDAGAEGRTRRSIIALGACSADCYGGLALSYPVSVLRPSCFLDYTGLCLPVSPAWI